MAGKSAEILCIGTELLMGDIVNTNAAFIARGLAGAGIGVYHQSVVGDNGGRLRQALELALSRADIVITTGGLGPTYDDLSKETVADYFGRPMELDPESLRRIESFFARLGHEMTENNVKQALMPQGATIFYNDNGTAPGCAIEQDGKTVVLLPGPPSEMEPMFTGSVLPFLQKFSERVLISRSLYFFGIGESALESKLHDLMLESANPTIAPYAKTGEVMLRVTASVEDPARAAALIDPAVEKILAAAGEYLYGVDVGDLQTALVRALEREKLRIAAAESCTGGLAAKRLTDVSGASGVFECGVCAYSERIKHALLGVREETLRAHGAVSPETAAEMAAGVRRLSGADIALAITGNAGPLPSEGKEVGLVYVAVDSPWHSEVRRLMLKRREGEERETIRWLASSHALSLGLKTLERRQRD